MKQRNTWRSLLFALHWSLVTGSLVTVLGCEALQKKFIRKSKKPVVRPTPIVTFQDYTTAMTPLDRYRKHFALFDYWNAQLLDELQQRNLNPKRARQASGESLQELNAFQELLEDDTASQMAPLLKERAQLDQQIQQGVYAPSQLEIMRRRLERQSRQINRELFWRKVEDRLKERAATDATAQ